MFQWYQNYFPFLVCVPDSVRSSAKLPEQAIVDEEAILSVLENSATFIPLSQTSNHSPLLGIVQIWISNLNKFEILGYGETC